MEIGLPIKRKARVETSLVNQKIKKKKTSSFKIKKFQIFIPAFFVIFSSLFLFCSLVLKAKNFLNKKNEITIGQFDIKFHGNFPNEIQEKITRNIERVIFSHSSIFESEYALAKEIQEKEGLSWVHVFRNLQNNISISISPRIPILYILTDRQQMVSIEGDIYDDHNFTPKNQTILTGIFQENKKFTLTERNTVKVTNEEKKTILDAIDLIEKAQKFAIFFSNIEYKLYRGYFATLQNSQTSVIIGNPPFEKQLQHLSKILEDSKKKNAVLKRVEVDYNDKAFITETKL